MDICNGRSQRDGGRTALTERCYSGQGPRKTCVSAKRTHFIFADFLMYQDYFQQLMKFAEAFANGLVLENESICHENGERIQLGRTTASGSAT
jgi:hypothetical protein